MTSREAFEAWRRIRGARYWANVTPEQAAEAAWEMAEFAALQRALEAAKDAAQTHSDAIGHIRALLETDK